jgi:GT2 family glycosyltransferase
MWILSDETQAEIKEIQMKTTYHPEPVYRFFGNDKFELYATSDSLDGAFKFVKKNSGRFKAIKVTKAKNNTGGAIVWVKV